MNQTEQLLTEILAELRKQNNNEKSELDKAKFYHSRIKATKGNRDEMRYWANKINRLQKKVGL